MDAGFSSIVWCSVADPYAVMMTADGTLMLLTFTCENSSPNLTVSRVHIDQVCIVFLFVSTLGFLPFPIAEAVVVICVFLT